MNGILKGGLLAAGGLAIAAGVYAYCQRQRQAELAEAEGDFPLDKDSDAGLPEEIPEAENDDDEITENLADEDHHDGSAVET